MVRISYLIICCGLLYISAVYGFQQDVFKFEYERLDVTWFNKNYSNEIKFVTFKYNRTFAATNMTLHFTRNLGNDITLRIQAYKFMSNEYRTFPLRFQFDMCNYAARNEFGLHQVFECGNFRCPVKAGLYHVCYFHLDARRFPANIPSGSWKLECTYLLYGEIEFLRADLYGRIDYPVV